MTSVEFKWSGRAPQAPHVQDSDWEKTKGIKMPASSYHDAGSVDRRHGHASRFQGLVSIGIPNLPGNQSCPMPEKKSSVMRWSRGVEKDEH